MPSAQNMMDDGSKIAVCISSSREDPPVANKVTIKIIKVSSGKEKFDTAGKFFGKTHLVKQPSRPTRAVCRLIWQEYEGLHSRDQNSQKL